METTIYVGKYKIPKNGIIPMPNEARLRVLSFYTGITSSGETFTDDRLTIVVEDENFWPVIIKLEDSEVDSLIRALQKIAEHRKRDEEATEQESYTIP